MTYDFGFLRDGAPLPFVIFYLHRWILRVCEHEFGKGRSGDALPLQQHIATIAGEEHRANACEGLRLSDDYPSRRF